MRPLRNTLAALLMVAALTACSDSPAGVPAGGGPDMNGAFASSAVSLVLEIDADGSLSGYAIEDTARSAEIASGSYAFPSISMVLRIPSSGTFWFLNGTVDPSGDSFTVSDPAAPVTLTFERWGT